MEMVIPSCARADTKTLGAPSVRGEARVRPGQSASAQEEMNRSMSSTMRGTCAIVRARIGVVRVNVEMWTRHDQHLVFLSQAQAYWWRDIVGGYKARGERNEGNAQEVRR